MQTQTARATNRRVLLNKVPEVTIYFWIIKVLCTTVGESFADYINETLGFGLANTTWVFSAALVVTLVGIPPAKVRAGGVLARGGADQCRWDTADRQPH